MAELTQEQAEAFVQAVHQLAAMADRALPKRRSPVAERLQAHLGKTADILASVSMSTPEVERVNVQLAFDAYAAAAERFEVIGLPSDIGNYGGLSLTAMIGGTWHGPAGEFARHYTPVEIDVDRTVDCLKSGLILTDFEGAPVVAMIYVNQHGFAPAVVVEVVGAERAASDGFLRRIKELMQEHNAFRGKVVSFAFGMHGEFGLTFLRLPTVSRDDIVLGPGELEAIEAHALGITEHSDGLRAAGQHIKRGLLLYGPPGTGKTHTISYLVGRMPGRTTLILSGGAVGAVGQAGTIARALQPATIVIEDVDLIALDRSLPGGEHNALLFQLLNEMDGLAEDADVLFVLTTNRADMLEPALAARPGRIDQAIELSLPGPAARRRLLEIYVGDLPADVDSIVARLEGAAPAFVKELARRTALVRLQDAAPVDPLTAALDSMIEHSTPILRRSLAAPGASGAHAEEG